MNRLEHHARRYLGGLEPYHDLISPSAAPPSWIDDVKLGDGEYLIGAYIPVVGEPTESIIVSNRGLHVERGGTWLFVGYDEQVDVSIPDEFKTSGGKLRVDRLTIVLGNGKAVDIPVRRHHSRFSDVFPIMTFLMHVHADIKTKRDARAGQG